MVSKATIVAIAATALAAVAPAHAQTTGGLEDFRLRPSAPDIQGPVTPDNPIVERPAPRAQTAPPPKIEVPAPKPAEPATSTPKPAPTAAKPDSSRSETQPTASASQPAPAQSVPAPSTAATGDAAMPTAPAATESPSAMHTVPTMAELPAAVDTPAPATTAPAPSAATAADSGASWWRYLVVLLLLIPMGIACFLFLRQNRGRTERVLVMPIERPKPRAVPSQDEPAAPEAPAPMLTVEEPEEEEAPLGPLRHALETTSLSVSLVNATLAYQLTLTNTSSQMIRNVTIYGDLVSAHSSLSMEEQLAGPGGMATPLHQIPALLPGQSTFLNGQLRLPISAIRPLRRDQAVLFVPLARMRIEAEGLEGALVQTCVVGQKPAGPGAGLRPFRLDTGPRIYAEIGQRTLDVPTPQAA